MAAARAFAAERAELPPRRIKMTPGGGTIYHSLTAALSRLMSGPLALVRSIHTSRSDTSKKGRYETWVMAALLEDIPCTTCPANVMPTLKTHYS